MMPSITYLRLSNVIIIFHITYFQFSIQSAYLPYIDRRAAPALRCTVGFNMQHWTFDVAENLARYVCCTERIAQRNDFELILTVKMETRRPIGGSVGSEFPALCDHCVVMAA